MVSSLCERTQAGGERLTEVPLPRPWGAAAANLHASSSTPQVSRFRSVAGGRSSLRSWNGGGEKRRKTWWSPAWAAAGSPPRTLLPAPLTCGAAMPSAPYQQPRGGFCPSLAAGRLEAAAVLPMFVDVVLPYGENWSIIWICLLSR